LPAALAACKADVSTACALVVGLKESTTPPSRVKGAYRGPVKMLVGLFNAVKVESVPLNSN
jgi:biotin synthase-like enzyme